MNNEKNTKEPIFLPVLPLRGLVAFPDIQMNVEIMRPASLKAFAEAATEYNAKMILVAQRELEIEDPTRRDLYEYGVVCAVKHVVKNTQNHLTVVFEGEARVKLDGVIKTPDGFLKASATLADTGRTFVTSPAIRAYMEEIKSHLSAIEDIHPSLSPELKLSAEVISDPLRFADFVASAVLIDYHNKEDVLETSTPKARLEKLYAALKEEEVLLECENDIRNQVREKIDESQKNYFLREQIKAIQSELGDEGDDEIEEYAAKIEKANLPDAVREKLEKELGKLAKTPFGAAEGVVMRAYLDTCLEFPFGVRTSEPVTVEEARRILDEDHDGLKKVKERILEFVAIKQFSPDIRSQIICLIGPPGVGKTSVAASIARALKRKYARVSLGGMHDEAEIRGHRKTYVGAMPGRIIQALISSGAENPVIVLDEIDKMANDFKGDPTSALLEVLDPEQNKAFRDNFLEIPVDLSRCLFIATANSYDSIPMPLLDRMEVIELSTYSDTDKISIAKNHIIPKQLSLHGMTKNKIRITDDCIVSLIKGYTREAGVRNLEREIASLIRKGAKQLAETGAKSITFSAKNLEKYLGKVKILPEHLEERNEVGLVNGLAYTQAGGDLLKVEVAVMEGTGKIELTGSLGDVMKESAKIAHSCVRTLAEKYKIDPNFYKDRDLHIHFPEGAVPKDGPSAGVTMVTAIVSALSLIPVRREIAMTGEITLRGKVLPIGGLMEKTLAAYRAGVSTVILPKDNLRDIDDIDPEAREHLQFIPVSTVEEVLDAALEKQ